MYVLTVVMKLSEIDPETIRRKALEVVSKPEFDLSSGSGEDDLNLGLRLLMWILKPVFWFLQSLGGMSLPLKIVVVSVLFLLLAALMTHLIYTFMKVIRGPVRRSPPPMATVALTPDALETLARKRAGEGDLIGAIRSLFKASLLRIEATEAKPFRKGITNREILNRYRSSKLFEPLNRLVDVIDTRWYGYVECSQADLAACEADYQWIRTVLEGRSRAIDS